ncbi:MAG: hypothetical protein M3N43_14800 [Actinomycetota bacterium]|nr:hypothetical protein [Actinomycetota bacterium]
MSAIDKWRYMVTLYPGVSIGPRKFVRVVDVDHPAPDKAVIKALGQMSNDETHLWQSDSARIEVERVA